MARRITPLDTRDRIARKLRLAGNPKGWDAERVLAFKVIGAIAGFVVALFVASLMSPAPFIATVIIGLLTFAGFVAPDSMLNRRVEERQREILRTLSDTLDLLTISVEAGSLPERGDRAGRAERARGAVVGVRPHAAGDPARRSALRCVPAAR